jgi:heptosyltransferase-3
MPGFREQRYRLKRWLTVRRQRLKERLSIWLTRRMGTPEALGEPVDSPPRTILICRVNKRLGNTLFVTPLLRSLAATLAGAQIDVLVRNKTYAPLLEGLPSVRSVMLVPDSLPARISLVRQLRRRAYDVAIDPSISSTTNRLFTRLSGARYKLGFASRHQWVHLTHAVPEPENELHQARQAVALMHSNLFAPPVRTFTNLCVHVSEQARQHATAVLEAALDTATGDRSDGPLVGFFPFATGTKSLSASWWSQWTKALLEVVPGAYLVRVVPPGHPPQPREARLVTVSFPELDRLAALIGSLDVFVAADSGPMHLAAAAGTPTIGLFSETLPELYAPLGNDCITIGPQDLEPSSVAARVAAHLTQIRSPRGDAGPR